MAKVGILMGSDSDLPIMSKAAKTLEQFGIDYEMTIISAHRMPDIFVDYAKTAKERGIKVIIAGAGGAAHLPGMTAALLAVKMLSMTDDSLVEKLAAYSVEMKDAVSAKADKLDKLGYEEYIKQM